MNIIQKKLEEVLKSAFASCGYDESLGTVVTSNRPDLCEYQCNGAMAGAKKYHKAPFVIADEVAAACADNVVFEKIESVKPGFINITVAPKALAEMLAEVAADEHLLTEQTGTGKKVIMDYGGPNVAKPLHVGHLRAAIIGESLKRIYRYAGYEVLGDIHLGDWGLQMGLIMEELRRRQPDLPYFDPAYGGEYPKEAPFTLSDLEEIYPTASARSKEDEAFAEAAHNATIALQKGVRGYRAIFEHIIHLSVTDLKKNYEKLDVHFDLWKGESDAQEFIPDMIADMETKGLLVESQGAMVVEVQEETDTHDVPPCLIKKSDGASLYATTDLATLVQRERDYHPDEVLYVVDKRQDMHFTQVFRTARKAGIIRPETKLTFLGFGTMNGKDGKPFKTREGGVMRLETLISDINEAALTRIKENGSMDDDAAQEVAEMVGLAALKYGDLSNQAGKNYVFDMDRFLSFEGNTGPYILYTIVRIKSILKKYLTEADASMNGRILPAGDVSEKALQLKLCGAGAAINDACDDIAPHRICQYIYEVSNAFNSFYHEHRILTESDKERKKSWIALISAALRVLETGIDLLGFSAPEQM